MTPQEADRLFQKSIDDALRYLQLTQDSQKDSPLYKEMKQAAIESLREFSDNDEAIDAMYEADREEYEW